MKVRQRRKAKKARNRSPQRSLREVLQDFLTPAVWKQAQQERAKSQQKKSPRWQTQPLILVLLFMTWCGGDSQAERFEVAKAYCQVWLCKRRGPGKTVQGFQKALQRLPLVVLRAVAAGMRRVLVGRRGRHWFYHDFVPIGCDGSRVECPRTPELEQRLGQAGKDKAAPTLWVTALVHLRWGVPWAWRLGKGTASERFHLLQMLGLLPRQALLVADAGYFGFALTQRLVGDEVMFLLRMSSNVTLYQQGCEPVQRFRDGEVYYWPGQKEAKASAQPLRLRLIRLRAKRRQNDVWLLTNVFDEARLPLAVAGQMYRWRWQNEGCFRTYKHTLKKVKLVSRTLRLVHREAEGSWLALQLLLIQGVMAQKERAGNNPAASSQRTSKTTAASAQQPPATLYSPRQILIAIRRDMEGTRRRGQPHYEERLHQARGEQRERTSAKASREWPRRKPHKAPKPPKLLTLSNAQKSLLARLHGKAA
jgi:hypothetical protein